MADNVRIGVLSGSDATDALHATIQKYNEENSKQTEQMLRLTRRMLGLTWVVAVLTFVMFAGLVIQIWLALIL